MQVCRVAVVPTEVTLVHGLHVVDQRAVVAGGVALTHELGRQLQLLGDLGGHQPVPGEAQGLVVHPAVQVALAGEVRAHVVTAPAGPVMRREHEVAPVGEQLDRLVDVLAPAERVSGLRAADRDEVVHGVRAVLGHAQPALVREVEVHLRRCFGLGCELEHDPDAVDHELLARVGDVLGGCDQAGEGQRRRLAQTAVDVAARAGRQQRPELVHRPTHHRIAGQQVLAHHLAHEVLGRDDPAPARVDVFLRGHAVHAAEVVEVRVRVDDGHDRPFAELGVGQGEAVAGAHRGGEWIDDDPAGLTLDEGDVRDVVVAGLPDAGRHLEQAVDAVQLRLSPQARVHSVGAGHVGRHEVAARHVPRHTELTFDDPGRVARQPPSPGPLEVGLVERRQGDRVARAGVRGGVVRLGGDRRAHAASLAGGPWSDLRRSPYRKGRRCHR